MSTWKRRVLDLSRANGEIYSIMHHFDGRGAAVTDRSLGYYMTFTRRELCHLTGWCVQRAFPDLAGSRTEATDIGARENRCGSVQNPNTRLPLCLSAVPCTLNPPLLLYKSSLNYNNGSCNANGGWWQQGSSSQGRKR